MRAIRFAWLVASAAAYASPASAPEDVLEADMEDPAMENTHMDELHEADMSDMEGEISLDINDEQLRRLFLEHIDTNGDGKVPVAELHDFSKKVRHNIAHNTHKNGEQSLFVSFDQNKDGKMAFDEVFEGDSTTMDWEKHMRVKFNAADKDKNGWLDEKEYPSFSHPDIDDEVEEAYGRFRFDQKDINKDGKLDYKELYGNEDGEVVDGMGSEGFQKEFKDLDHDGSGFIEFQEAKEWESERHDIETAMEWLADHADKNNDGQVTVDEFIAAKHGMQTQMAGYHLEEWVKHLEL